MTGSKRIRVAWISLVLSAIAAATKMSFVLSSWLLSFMSGVELVFLLIAIGYSAKLLGSMGVEKNIRGQSTLVLVISAALAIYIYLI